MATPQDPLGQQPSTVPLTRKLIRRRVPHILAIYAGVSWGLVEFTAFAADEFMLSPLWTRIVLATLLLLLPSVVMLAWFHGKPGRDRDSPARAEKIGIPANLVLCAAVLWALFGGEEPDSAAAARTGAAGEGDSVAPDVVGDEYRKPTALFPFAVGPGIGEDEAWVSYAVPEALVLDLMADDYFAPITFFGYELEVERRGFASTAEAPVALKREFAQDVFAAFMATGEIDRADDVYGVTLRVYRAGDGSVAGETTREGTDLLALVDEMSGAVKTVLEIPAREGVEDLPVRGRLSEDDAAVEAFFQGFFHWHARDDPEAAISYLTTATTRDPTFTVAQHTLSRVLEVSGEGQADAVTPLVAAMDNLYRVSERYGFRIRADYFRLTGEMDRAEDLVEAWVQLYPNDLEALEAQVGVQRSAGDLEGMLATLGTIQSLNPLDGGVLRSMAWAHEMLGDDDRALALLTEYTERFPGDVTGYMGMVRFHRREGRHDKVREYLERVIVLDPLEPRWVLELAGLDLDVGRLDEGLAGYERAMEQARTPLARARVLRGIGDYRRRRGEMADAVRAIDAAIEEERDFRTALGLVPGRLEDVFDYLEAGDVDEAADLRDELLAASLPEWSFDGQRMTLRIALAQGNLDAAREAHRQASEAVEGVASRYLPAELLGDLGLIRERAGDYAGAAESFRAAVALWPEPEQHRRAGRALRLAGRLDEAEDELEEVLRLVPADPHANFEMALVLEARRDIGEAVEHLRSALAVWETADGDFEPAREARAKLAELRGWR